MKKFILIALIASVTLSAYSAPKIVDYVVTDDGISYFVKVRHGFNNYLIAKTEDGTKVKFKAEEVKSFRKKAEVFHKRQLVIDGKACEDCKFLKLLAAKCGCGLYEMETFENGQSVKQFYVFNGDDFVLQVNYDNYLQMFDFFGIS